MEQQMPPNPTPKTAALMGSVFGTPMTGFALVTQGAAQPASAVTTPAIMPTDVLTQDVMTLKVEVRDLKSEIEGIKEAVSKIVAQSSVKAPEPLFVTSADTPNPLAPVVKKKAGRPKKVVA